MSVASIPQTNGHDHAGFYAAAFMRKSPRTCSPQSTVLEAVLIFKDEDCGLVPVVDGGKPVGVVTDRDVALGLADKPDLESHPVEEIMTRNPVWVELVTPLVDVARILASKGLRRVLVVDDQGDLQGVIGWSDIAPSLSFSALEAIVAESKP
jgi:CBS domain-containing protein